MKVEKEAKSEMILTEQTPIEEKKEVAEVEKERSSGGAGATGIAYVFGSSNNTIVHITDMVGNTVTRISGGMITKHSRLKANPTTAMFVAKRAAEVAKEAGIGAIYVRMRGKTNGIGMGPGVNAAVKTLNKEGFKILGVVDTTRMPRGGPKKPYGKRGRRV